MNLLHELSPGPLSRTLCRAWHWIKTETMIQIAQSETFVPETGFCPSIDAYRRFFLALKRQWT